MTVHVDRYVGSCTTQAPEHRHPSSFQRTRILASKNGRKVRAHDRRASVTCHEPHHPHAETRPHHPGALAVARRLGTGGDQRGKPLELLRSRRWHGGIRGLDRTVQHGWVGRGPNGVVPERQPEQQHEVGLPGGCVHRCQRVPGGLLRWAQHHRGRRTPHQFQAEPDQRGMGRAQRSFGHHRERLRDDPAHPDEPQPRAGRGRDRFVGALPEPHPRGQQRRGPYRNMRRVRNSAPPRAYIRAPFPWP